MRPSSGHRTRAFVSPFYAAIPICIPFFLLIATVYLFRMLMCWRHHFHSSPGDTPPGRNRSIAMKSNGTAGIYSGLFSDNRNAKNS